MSKKKSFVLSLKKFLSAPWINWFWGAVGAGAWIGMQVWHAERGVPFSSLVFLKGLVLLGLATTVYQFSRFAKGPSLLGLFPLLWLSVSKFQWSLCAAEDFHYWLWMVLFLVSEILIFKIPDGKQLLFCLVPLWIALTWLFPFSFLLPLVFLTASKGRFKNSPWVRWGGLFAGLALFVLFREWKSYHFDWIGPYDLLITGRNIAFFLLGWLGLVAFPRKGAYRHAVFPLFLLSIGFLFWPVFPPFPPGMEMFRWVLVFFAGFGWESFRRDLMDPTWHGHLVWASLGLAFLTGVI